MNPPKKKPLNLDRSDLVALTALLLSMLALFVSIYEARILKSQQEIMFAQSKASAWPYLDTNIKYDFSDRFRIIYTVKNKGTGPALIKMGRLTVNDREVTEYLDILEALKERFPEAIDFGLSTSLVKDEVLSPDETVEIFVLDSERFAGDATLVRDLSIQYQICYCSIYDDCWSINQPGGKPIKGCE